MKQSLFHKFLSLVKYKEEYQLNSSGLNYIELHVLESVYKSDGVKTLDISKSLSIPPSTLISILDKLEKLKLVKRERQKDDKRIVLVSLTGEGVNKVNDHFKQDDIFLRNLLSKLDKDELDSFNNLLEKLTSAAENPAELFEE